MLYIEILDEFKSYLKLFLNLNSPVYYSILSVIISFVTIYFIFKYVVLPQRIKNIIEKQKLIKDAQDLIILFAELDPDPIIRFNQKGVVEFINPAAKNYGFEKYLGKNINSFLQDINLNGDDFISENRTKEFIVSLLDKIFSLQFREINNLQLTQVYFHDITKQQNFQVALQVAKDEADEFSKHLQKTIENERRRISRELHDSIGQKLVFLKLNLQKNYFILTGIDDSMEYLESQSILDESINDLKTISFTLKPSILEDLGIIPALKSLIEIINSQNSIKGELEYAGIITRLDTDLETAIYRITQEALNNIVKYASAVEFSVNLIFYKNMVRLIITDDGNGFLISEAKKMQGMGLRNMKERVEICGGSFRIDTALNEGTIITADFPLKEGCNVGK